MLREKRNSVNGRKGKRFRSDKMTVVQDNYKLRYNTRELWLFRNAYLSY